MGNKTQSPPSNINPIWSIIPALVIYLLLTFVPFFDIAIHIPTEHFAIVSAASLFAAAISIAIGISGVNLRNSQVIFVSLAYISLTVYFSLHGLSTPGFILEGNRVVVIAVQLSFMLITFWLWLSSLPGTNKIILFLGSRRRATIFVWTLLMVSTAAASLINPDLVMWVPVDEIPLRTVTAVLTIILAGSASLRYWRSYRYAQFPLQFTLAHAAGLMIIAQIIISTGQLWHSGWWFYHIILVIVVILTTRGLIQQYRQGDSLLLAIRGLFSSDPVERLEAGISPKVQDLVNSVENHDTYTAGHAHRVALSAVQLGIAVSCSPDDLRALAQGGILHDLGKLDLPQELLNKPGPLTPEERAQVNQHPIKGLEFCQHLGMMPAELEIIRSHHEHVDGMGYPDGLSGEEIPRLARLLAVTDVYDALTSDRAYRPALSKEEACKHLISEKGKSFDPKFVEAWLALTD